MKYAIVVTSIFVPELLEKYVDDVLKFKRDCFFVYVGDKKTPEEAKVYCTNLSQKKGVEIVFMDIPWQEEYLKDFPELREHLPYNSVMRRNIGILYAYQRASDVVITIDDDNFLVSEDFAGLHTVGNVKKVEVISSNTGWFNVCSFLREEFGRVFYHRGFSQEARFKDEQTENREQEVKVVANAGFWLGDPDIDALTRLYYLARPINATAYERPNNFGLAAGTWSPFNSQNTALAREVIPAYFLSPMVGRYDDIWGSYVLKHIADHLGHVVTFGFPIVEQKRNPHNYWKDLARETDGMLLTDRFVTALSSLSLSGASYASCYKEIAQTLPEALAIEECTEEHKNFLLNYLAGMNVWVKTFERLEH